LNNDEQELKIGSIRQSVLEQLVKQPFVDPKFKGLNPANEGVNKMLKSYQIFSKHLLQLSLKFVLVNKYKIPTSYLCHG